MGLTSHEEEISTNVLYILCALLLIFAVFNDLKFSHANQKRMFSSLYSDLRNSVKILIPSAKGIKKSVIERLKTRLTTLKNIEDHH